MTIKKTDLPLLKLTIGKIFFLLLLPFLVVQNNFSQVVETKKKDKISAEFRKDALSFLRETTTDVNNMRTLENRISFSAELANLMWFNDEKEARAMFKSVITDFRQLLTQFDAPETATETEEEASLLVGGRGGDFNRKFFKATAVRQQISTNLAEHDPQLAFDFLAETAQAISNPKLRLQLEQNSYFEMQLLNRIAEKNVDVALKHGRKALEKGFNAQMGELLKKIYAKDAEKGASFGEDILKKIKSVDATPDNFYHLSMLLSLGNENLEQIKKEPGKRPMFSEQSMRELADLLGQALLKRENLDHSEITQYLPQVEKFAPARAAQMRQKMNSKNTKNGTAPFGDAPRPPMPATNTSQADKQKKLMEDVESLKTKTLSKEERQKVVEQARKIIAGVKNRDQKLFALSALAAQVALSGDKESASQIMDDARSLINPQPKNYREYTETWIVITGYAGVDTEKAFPMLENTIFRLNETISAAIKVAEFIDTSNDIIEDGEVQVGSFGGEITRGLLRSLGTIDMTIQNLAKADFVRAKALTNKFERQEIRILAKMIVLRGILGESHPSNGEIFD
ncbi:MAG: hypothetical protein WKF71_08390 [Pyrinomonadaceae bacterium]